MDPQLLLPRPGSPSPWSNRIPVPSWPRWSAPAPAPPPPPPTQMHVPIMPVTKTREQLQWDIYEATVHRFRPDNPSDAHNRHVVVRRHGTTVAVPRSVLDAHAHGHGVVRHVVHMPTWSLYAFEQHDEARAFFTETAGACWAREELSLFINSALARRLFYTCTQAPSPCDPTRTVLVYVGAYPVVYTHA